MRKLNPITHNFSYIMRHSLFQCKCAKTNSKLLPFNVNDLKWFIIFSIVALFGSSWFSPSHSQSSLARLNCFCPSMSVMFRAQLYHMIWRKYYWHHEWCCPNLFAMRSCPFLHHATQKAFARAWVVLIIVLWKPSTVNFFVIVSDAAQGPGFLVASPSPKPHDWASILCLILVAQVNLSVFWSSCMRLFKRSVRGHLKGKQPT